MVGTPDQARVQLAARLVRGADQGGGGRRGNHHGPQQAPGGGSGMLVSLVFPGPYRMPRFGFSSDAVFTNTCGKAAYRGPWAIETIVREQLIDHAACELGLDPLELRRRNVIRPS